MVTHCAAAHISDSPVICMFKNLTGLWHGVRQQLSLSGSVCFTGVGSQQTAEAATCSTYSLSVWLFTNQSLLLWRGCLSQTSIIQSQLSRFMTSSDLKHSCFTHLTQSAIVIQTPFSLSCKGTSSPAQCKLKCRSSVYKRPLMLWVSLYLRMEGSTARALNSNSQKSLWKYVRNASWATGKAARMCFCGDWDFTSPETGSIRHSKQTLWDYWEL